MATDLVPIPPIPAGLREAALIGKLIPFIGAGASRLAGCPGWAEFADGALRQLIEEGRFTHSQLDQIKHLSPRIQLSIATSIAADTKTPINYEILLHPTARTDHKKGRRLIAVSLHSGPSSSRRTTTGGLMNVSESQHRERSRTRAPLRRHRLG